MELPSFLGRSGVIHGIIAICPECRAVLKFNAHQEGYFCGGPILCEEDGYVMKQILMNDIFIDQLLKNGAPSAN